MSVVTYEGAPIDVDKKRRLVEALSQAMSDVLEVPPSATRIFIREHAPENIGLGGRLLADYPPEAQGRESRAVRPHGPTPHRILDLHFAFAPPRVLASAVELGVFAALGEKPADAAGLAERLKASPRGMAMILDALTGLGFVQKKERLYHLSDEARHFLLPGASGYLGDLVAHVDHLWDAWGHLTESVVSGRPARAIAPREGAADLFSKLVPGLYQLHYRTAHALADHLSIGKGRQGLSILDVGAGSGVWSIALCMADSKAKATAIDFPEVLEITRTFARRHEVTDQFTFNPGDLRDADLGTQTHDLVILGHICHSEGEAGSRKLFARAFQALRPGGILVLAEICPDEDRQGPLFPLLFALNMLVSTPEGGTFTGAEYRSWLRDTGFRRVDSVDLGAVSPLLLAYKL